MTTNLPFISLFLDCSKDGVTKFLFSMIQKPIMSPKLTILLTALRKANLNIKMTHSKLPFCCFTDYSKSLYKKMHDEMKIN